MICLENLDNTITVGVLIKRIMAHPNFIKKNDAEKKHLLRLYFKGSSTGINNYEDLAVSKLNVDSLGSIGINRFSFVEYGYEPNVGGFMNTPAVRIFHGRYFNFEGKDGKSKIDSKGRYYFEVTLPDKKVSWMIDFLLKQLHDSGYIKNEDKDKLFKDWSENKRLVLSDKFNLIKSED